MAAPSFNYTFSYSPFRVDPFNFSHYVKVIAFNTHIANMLVVFTTGAWSVYVATLSSMLLTRAIVNSGQDPSSFLATQTLVASGHY